MVAEFGKMFLDQGDFGQPTGDVHAEQLGKIGGGNVEAPRVQLGRGRQKSDWRFEGRGLALTAFEDPLQHTAVLAVSGPQKFSVFILTKPVDVINLWQLLRLGLGSHSD